MNVFQIIISARLSMLLLSLSYEPGCSLFRFVFDGDVTDEDQYRHNYTIVIQTNNTKNSLVYLNMNTS